MQEIARVIENQLKRPVMKKQVYYILHSQASFASIPHFLRSFTVAFKLASTSDVSGYQLSKASITKSWKPQSRSL